MMKTKKKSMICIYKGDVIEADMEILENLSSKEFEVHLFNDVDESNLQCDILPYIIKNIYGVQSNEYDIYISSNIKEFIMLEYVLYKNWISGALYINNNSINIELEGLYRNILDKEICEYSNSSDFYLLKEGENVFPDCHIFDGNFDNNFKNKSFKNKIYIYRGMNHVFGIRNDKSKVNIDLINLDNSNNTRKYNYHFDIGYVEEYIKSLEYYSNFSNDFIKYNAKFNSDFEENKMNILNLSDFEKNIVQFRLDNELFNKENSEQYNILLSSVLLNIFDESIYLEYLLNTLIESRTINKYNMFFAYSQCERYKFISNNMRNEKTDTMMECLYEKIHEEFLDEISEKYLKISKEQLNNNSVFVITSQYLSINHAPTKVALDVCYNLMNNLNKKVVLINTKEICTLQGIIQMGNIALANVLDSLDNIDSIKYRDIKIPFYQGKGLMPNESEIINILNMLEKHKPSMVINIGTTLVGDLCTRIIPTVTIPLGINGYSKSTFYVINNEEDFKNYSSKHNRDKESLITEKAAFELKPQINILNRNDLGIPQDKFIIAVIGNRLNDEIDEEFLNVLEESCKLNNSYVLFIDNFNFSELQSFKYKNLMRNYKNMGYQKDLLAVLEHIDLYVNPNRSGGGSSAIYALFLGKPVVTLNHGDVYYNVGKDFCVCSYHEMVNEIYKYCSNNEFYNKQSDIAKKIAINLTDVFKYIKNIYEKVIQSHLYKNFNS